MMAEPDNPEPLVYQPMALPPRRRLQPRAALNWLTQGLGYLGRAKGISIAYGGIFAAVCMLITWFGLSRPQFILTFWSGFLLIGPLFAMGFYRVAQMLDRGEPIHLTASWQVLRSKLGTVALFTLLLSLVMIAWIRFSTLAAALYAGEVIGSSSFIATLGSPEGLGFLALLFGVGAIFAAVMFAVTAWSLPLVLEGRADFGVAIVASVKAVIEQPVPMLIWGALVATLTIIGMLTLFIAFAVIFPLLGYATWAGYRELFGSD